MLLYGSAVMTQIARIMWRVTMAKHKGDIEIGRRATEELKKRFPNMTEYAICKRLGLDRKTLYFWKTGGTPSVFALQRIYYEGCDVLYVLTGKRGSKDGSKSV
jgi:hypothetical protein